MENSPCFYSLFIFGKKNKFRLFCHKFTSYKFFDTIFVIMIILSTIKVAYGSFLDIDISKHKIHRNLLRNIGFTCNIYFTNVIFLKIVMNGFYWDKKSYLRNNLNICSFISVCGFWLSLYFVDSNELKVYLIYNN